MSTPRRVADLFRESIKSNNSSSYDNGIYRHADELEEEIKDNKYKVAVFNITHQLFQGDNEYYKNILDFLTGWCEGCNSNKLRCDNDKYFYYVNNIGVVDKIEIDKYEKLPKRFKCFELCRKFEVIEYSYINNYDADKIEVLVREQLDDDSFEAISDAHGKWIKLKYCYSLPECWYRFKVDDNGPIFWTYDKNYKDGYKLRNNTSAWRQCIPYNKETMHLEGTNTDYKWSMFH